MAVLLILLSLLYTMSLLDARSVTQHCDIDTVNSLACALCST